METIKCIKTRRSRRLFLKKEVSDEIIKKLIDCAIAAPSSQNCQPWHFIIVKDDDLKIKLAKLKEEGNQQHILTAYVSIVICVDKNISPTRWLEDGVCATENLLLAAHNMGLGSVYITGFNSLKPEITESIKSILDLPENIIPITILPIGYPDSSEKVEKKLLCNVTDIIHYDKW